MGVDKIDLSTFQHIISFIFQCNSELFKMEDDVSAAANQFDHSVQINRTNYSGNSHFSSGLNDSHF